MSNYLKANEIYTMGVVSAEKSVYFFRNSQKQIDLFCVRLKGI